MLRHKLQEEGLRTYLLAYGRFYSSLSISQLCDMFELPENKVTLHNVSARHILQSLPCGLQTCSASNQHSNPSLTKGLML